MNTLIKILESYNGRDKVIRTASYLSLYLGAKTKGSMSRNLRMISRELSYCRLILRLFDDLPMLKYTLSYGFGREEKHLLLRILSILNNIVDQIYYPVEHLAWAAEKKLVNASTSLWSIIGAALWGLSSYISVLRSLIIMSILQKKTYGLKNLSAHEAIVKEQLEHFLAAIKSATDAAIAINYLPVGSLLWAGKLNSRQIGLLGLLSSLLSLVLVVRNLEKV